MERLFKAFREADKELFLVGGAVRDLALGIKMEQLDDLDFCTNALPAESLNILRRNKFSTYEMGFEFGTVGATLKGPDGQGFPKDVQVTTYRSAEFYRRGSRHPQVKFGSTIEQDLKRRDFSINSMAFDENGDFFDPYDGLGDLKNGILRVVSDPFETLAEDPLRILRVARFVSRLGFSIDSELMKAACARAENIKDISRERWLQEMNKLIVGDYVIQAMDFLLETGVLAVILPELEAETSRDRFSNIMTILARAPKSKALRWGILFHEILAGESAKKVDKTICEITKRFTFDNDMAKEVRAIVRHQNRIFEYDAGCNDAFVRRLYLELDPAFHLLCDFAETKSLDNQIPNLRKRVQDLASDKRLVPELPKGIGEEIITTFCLTPCKMIGDIKTFLLDEIIEDRLESMKSSEHYVAYLRQHFDGLN